MALQETFEYSDEEWMAIGVGRPLAALTYADLYELLSRWTWAQRVLETFQQAMSRADRVHGQPAGLAALRRHGSHVEDDPPRSHRRGAADGAAHGHVSRLCAPARVFTFASVE